MRDKKWCGRQGSGEERKRKKKQGRKEREKKSKRTDISAKG